jgi:hypothetical protein
MQMRIKFVGLALTITKNIYPQLRFIEFSRNVVRESDLVIDVGSNKGHL